MAVIALEDAIRIPGTQVHFGAPYQNALKDFLLPIFNEVLKDCPEDLLPKWHGQTSKWNLPNGSTIKLFGTNNGQYENSRGNKSDLYILDEAAQVDGLDFVVKDVALPQLLSSTNPSKKIILPSTPPKTPDHPFKRYAETAKARGAYAHFTIYDSTYSPAEIARFTEEVGGADSTTFKREFLAQFVVDSTLHIIPEWDSKYIQDIPKDDAFQFYAMVEGLDIGYRDFTAWVLGYYDWKRAVTVIEYEFDIRENDFTTEALAKAITEIENLEYRKLNQTRFRRISDNNNLNLLADLSRLHKIPFAPVTKNKERHGKEWMVNQTREAMKSGKVIIHPRCKKLIASLEFGIWKEGHSEFARSEELGHYDYLDAFIYLMAVLIPTLKNTNPIPPLYQMNVATTMFPNGIPVGHPNPQDETLKRLFKGL